MPRVRSDLSKILYLIFDSLQRFWRSVDSCWAEWRNRPSRRCFLRRIGWLHTWICKLSSSYPLEVFTNFFFLFPASSFLAGIISHDLDRITHFPQFNYNTFTCNTNYVFNFNFLPLLHNFVLPRIANFYDSTFSSENLLINTHN